MSVRKAESLFSSKLGTKANWDPRISSLKKKGITKLLEYAFYNKKYYNVKLVINCVEYTYLKQPTMWILLLHPKQKITEVYRPIFFTQLVIYFHTLIIYPPVQNYKDNIPTCGLQNLKLF